MEKSNNESALKIAKILVGKDTSWESTSSAVDQSKTKPHKYGSNSFDVGSTEKGGGGDETGGGVDDQGGGGEGSSSSNISLKQVEAGGITPLFLATKLGCIEIVTEILDKYPQAVEHIDNEGRTILHVAIKYRQLEVFELVLKMEVAMRWLIRRLDNNGNSILHMVGIKREDYVPEKLRGPAFELQEELLWFEVTPFSSHLIFFSNNKI